MPQNLKIQKPVLVNNTINRENRVKELNADFSVSVTVETKVLDWPVSPTAGIKQKCFERVEKKLLRLTTLVQFPKGHKFKRFGHAGGVEFYVLSGIFSDSDGDYSAGSYVRNPPGSYIESYTGEGCTILLKLGQSQPLDRKRIVVNTTGPAISWLPVGEPGVSRLKLHHFSEEVVSLYRIRSECWLTFKQKSNVLEVLVCEGSIVVKKKHYSTGSWLRFAIGSKVRVSAIGDVCLYAKKSICPK